MKKLLTMLLALALMLGATIPALADSSLLSWNGFQVTLTGYDIREDGDGQSYIHMDVHVINNTSRSIWLHMDNVQIDGTAIYGAGIVGIEAGANMDDWLLLKPNDTNPDGGDGAIRTGSLIDMTLILDDDDSYEELYRQDVHINLNSLSASSGPSDSSSSTYSGQSANTAPAYTPASYNFQTLKQGSKGQAVKDLQQRLTDLGYLNDKIDGSFGNNTGVACMSFCTQHGLYIEAVATPEMQELLYSSNAQYYQEPWVPLIIGPRVKWNNVHVVGDWCSYYTQVVNRSNRTIRGYELYYYMTDVWDNRYYNDAGPELCRTTCQEAVKPGYTVYSGPMYIDKYAWTYNVWVGVHKVIFDDGEVRETPPDEIVYFKCQLTK